MGNGYLNILPTLPPVYTRQTEGPIGGGFTRAIYEKLRRVLPFGSFFESALKAIGNKKFSVIVINPQSFGAINDSFNHRVGDNVRDKMGAIIDQYFKGKGKGFAVFELQGINRVILLEGVDEKTAKEYSNELKERIEKGGYEDKIMPKEIENDAARRIYKEYVAKLKGIPESEVADNVLYKVDIKNFLKAQLKKSITLNIGLISSAAEGSKEYNSEQITKAVVRSLNKVNQENNGAINIFALKDILNGVSLVNVEPIKLSQEGEAALKRLLENKKLQKAILESPGSVQRYMLAKYWKLIPQELRGQIKNMSVFVEVNPQAMSTHIRVEDGKIVIPLVNAYGKTVAQVKIELINGVKALPPGINDKFNLNERTLGGMALQLNLDIYRDPKSHLFKKEVYYNRLKELHANKTKYVLVRGDIRHFGSWQGFNKGFSISGTEMGDKLFKHYFAQMQEFFRQKGVALESHRLGGDEVGFILVKEGLTQEDVRKLFEEFSKDKVPGLKLNDSIRKEVLPEEMKAYLDKYVNEKKILINKDGSYPIDLYDFIRHSKKHGVDTSGMILAIGIIGVDPEKQKDYKKVDADADGLANRAKENKTNIAENTRNISESEARKKADDYLDEIREACKRFFGPEREKEVRNKLKEMGLLPEMIDRKITDLRKARLMYHFGFDEKNMGLLEKYVRGQADLGVLFRALVDCSQGKMEGLENIGVKDKAVQEQLKRAINANEQKHVAEMMESIKTKVDANKKLSIYEMEFLTRIEKPGIAEKFGVREELTAIKKTLVEKAEAHRRDKINTSEETPLENKQNRLLERIKEYAKNAFNVILKSYNTKGQINWILKATISEIAEKYEITEENALKFKQETARDVYLPIFENCQIMVNAEGKIVIETKNKNGEIETKEFSTIEDAHKYMEKAVRDGDIKLKGINLLDARPGVFKVGVGTAGTALTGLIADMFVASVFETYKSVKDGNYKFNSKNVKDGAKRGFVGWGGMALKQGIAQLLGATPKVAMLYAIFLPMLKDSNNLNLSINERFNQIPSGFAGFGAFVGVEKIWNKLVPQNPLVGVRPTAGARFKGIVANWSKRVGGAGLGALGAALTAEGIILLLNSKWAQKKISLETKEKIVDNVNVLNDRLSGYVTGELVGLSRYAANALKAIPRGYAGLLTAFSGGYFDTIIDTVGAFGSNPQRAKYEKFADLLHSQWIDNELTKKLYNWPLLIGRGLAQDIFGKKLSAKIDAIGNNANRDSVIKQTVNKYWQSINQFYAAVLLKHMKIESGDNKSGIKYEFDVNAINREVNNNREIYWMLGFIGNFDPKSFTIISNRGNYTIDQAGAKKYFDYFSNSGFQLPLQKENGAIEYKTFKSIIDGQIKIVQAKREKMTQVNQRLVGERRIELGPGYAEDVKKINSDIKTISKAIEALEPKVQKEISSKMEGTENQVRYVKLLNMLRVRAQKMRKYCELAGYKKEEIIDLIKLKKDIERELKLFPMNYIYRNKK